MHRRKQFQFYLSSIKSIKCCSSIGFSPSFNSTLVQLKADFSEALASLYDSFNSTLVQLKVITRSHVVLSFPSFQFYLSSIKRTDAATDALKKFKFQFYLSSIKSILPSYLFKTFSKVSILP